MKKTLVVKLAVAAMLVLGSLAHAQDDAVTPTPDDGKAAPVQTEGQDSASDAVADEVAPVQPVEDSVINATPIMAGNDCVGCGQSAPAFGSPMGYSPMAYSPNSGAPISMGCGSCSSGCAGCGTVQMAAPIYQPSYGCGSCGQIGQVTYDQPISVVANPITINPAPMAVAPQTSCCNPCNTCAPAPVVTTCCDCCPPRGLLRGRIFRNR